MFFDTFACLSTARDCKFGRTGGLSYKKQPDQYQVLDGETLVAVIALGYGANQGNAHPQKKGIEHFCHV